MASTPMANVFRIAALGAVVSVVPVAGVADASAAMRPSDAYSAIARQAPAVLGGGYVCRVASRSNGRIGRTILFVADRLAKARARRWIRKLGASFTVSIRIGEQRRRRRDLKALLARMRADAPARALARGGIRIGFGASTGPRCPKIVVRDAVRENSGAALDFVSDAPHRDGADRVEVFDGPGTSS